MTVPYAIDPDHSTRLLVIKHGSMDLSLQIPTHLFPIADEIKDLLPAMESLPDSEDTLKSDIGILSHLWTFALSTISATAVNEYEIVSFTREILLHFHNRYVKSMDIHAIIHQFPTNLQETLLRNYYVTLTLMQKHHLIMPTSGSIPPLFAAAARKDATLLAVFGGQGNVEDYFSDLENAFSIYPTIVRPFLAQLSAFLFRYASSPEAKSVFSGEIDVLKWLDNPETKPSKNYFLSAPVSLPVIGISQLVWYYLIVRIMDVEPDQVRQYFTGATGHSQGIISAVVMSVSSTHKQFLDNCHKAIFLLFWIGLRSHAKCPATTIAPAILQDSLEEGEGVPTPMLSVNGLPASTLKELMASTNSHLPSSRHVKLSLSNGPRNFVLTGHPQSLYAFNLSLRPLKSEGEDQSKIPFSQRKKKFSARFLPVMIPFHSESLQGVQEEVEQDWKRAWGSQEWEIKHQKSFMSAVPVFDTFDGSNVLEKESLLSTLISLITTKPVFWEKATNVPGLTHVLDFGPGGMSGIGVLTGRNKEGRGVKVILASILTSTSAEILDRAGLFGPEQYGVDWAKKFKPKLVKIVSTNEIHVDTPFSRLLGKPPLMVAGMTPSTSNDLFVAATINAGYHIELAGGGMHSPNALSNTIQSIVASTPPGSGITVNILYLNARQWSVQIPTVIELRSKGVPIEGVCVAAGVPSPDVADDVISKLKSAGIRHISFKPGSVDGIRRVVSIAKHNPDMPIILQWTGGRAGGHHSYEDFHTPILETYALIRRQPNICLVAGSGFGDDVGTLPYLTGEWSLRFDYPVMPFDGILFASRVMVAKEGLASKEVKELIVQAAGVSTEEEHMWERSYKSPIGGVVTVKSELGEPIHKIATRGVLLWKELDETVFSLPRDKRGPVLRSKKDYIIKRLNADFQKPWFGKRKDGTIVDLQEMTYEEVILRMIELLYIFHKQQWIHITHRDLVCDILSRIESRFAKSSDSHQPILQSNEMMDDPMSFVTSFFKYYPDATVQILTTEDVLYFLTCCQRRGQKPVPFIPVLDDQFEVWFKKDSLWQSENLDAVIDRDPQRVCILQGPVAAKHSHTVDEPIADILGNIYKSHISSLTQLYYDGNTSAIPTVEYLGGNSSVKVQSLVGVKVSDLEGNEGKSKMYEIISRSTSDLPDSQKWFELMAGEERSWLRAFFTSEMIVQGRNLVPNPIRRILKPRPQQTVFIKYSETGKAEIISVYQISKMSQIPSRKPAVVISAKGDIITLDLMEDRYKDSPSCSVRLMFKYCPTQGCTPIHEIMEGRNSRIKDFYAKLWSVDNSLQKSTQRLDSETRFTGTFKVTAEHILEFCKVVENQAEAFVSGDVNHKRKAPMDFGIVAAWKPLISAILPEAENGDLLRLVHLSNEYQMLGKRLLQEGDEVYTEAKVEAIVISDIGKTVEVKARLFISDSPIMEIVSKFLYRGVFTEKDYASTFRRSAEHPMKVILTSSKDIAVLMSKEWVQWKNGQKPDLSPMSVLIFRLETLMEFKTSSIFSYVETTGSVFLQTTKETVEIGLVNYTSNECHGNVVLEYLKRHGSPIEQVVSFENGGYSITPNPKMFEVAAIAPESNEPYAMSSGDVNPIHVNPYFADLAGLPGTITHGMWTSAATRKFVETFAADNRPERVKMFQVNFVDMVLPGDRLSTTLRHVGMSDGKKVIRVETLNQHGIKVLEGVAEVDQPVTSYVFTGQGSQEVGMGMDLYATSPIAKEIWDRADQHMLLQYGISILDIVRNNPLQTTVHFGGALGDEVRKNYQSMMYEVMDSTTGSIKRIPLFPSIHDETESFTFSHPNGLLSATQFTQPALTLMEIASFCNMKTHSLVQKDCCFAGHSLGEYAALASMGEVLSVENLVDVVFYRGMTMQVAVPRNATGRSNYGMAAVNPTRVGRGFGEFGLKIVVESIAKESKDLLEIVNYNVENWQYVAAGTLVNLDALKISLDHMKKNDVDFKVLVKTKTPSEIENMLLEVIRNSINSAHQRQKANNGIPVQERGQATVPLAGIDVPFHSSFLLNGVGPFREILKSKLECRFVNVHLLADKYIPNLTAKPFQISKTYIQDVYDLTKSPILKTLLDDWIDTPTPDQQQERGYILLIELLAHQFASPVQWIQTQDVLFRDFGVERLIEVGPSPVLCGMASRTLKFKYEAYDAAISVKRSNLCYAKSRKEIHYDFEDVPLEETETTPTSASTSDMKSKEIDSSSPVIPSAGSILSSGPAAQIQDVPLTAKEVLHTLICHKLKKKPEEVSMSKTIKDLVGGKSTLQNEILGDLGAEFGNVLAEKAEENPLSDIAEQLNPSFSGNLGKVSSGLISKMIGGRMPGGFNMGQVKGYLNTRYGLGPQRVDGVLLQGLLYEPNARLGSEAEAKQWLDQIAAAYASSSGITFQSSSGGADGQGNMSGVVTVNSEDFLQFRSKTDVLARQQYEAYAKYLDMDIRAVSRLIDLERTERASMEKILDNWTTEHGDVYAQGILPAFDPLKARLFDSHWNWARQDALQLYYKLVFGQIVSVERTLMNECIHLMNRAESYTQLIDFMSYYLERCPAEKGENYARCKELGNMLLDNCKNALSKDPIYMDVSYRPTKPRTEISANGSLIYKEEVRSEMKSMKDYVAEMKKGSSGFHQDKNDSNNKKIENPIVKLNELKRLLTSCNNFDNTPQQKEKILTALLHLENAFTESRMHVPENLSYLHLRSRSTKDPNQWEPNTELTNIYLDTLAKAAAEGLSFKDKNVLITGCGKDSIGVEVLKGLLSGGGRVIVTTSRFNTAATQFYRGIYEQHGSKGSRLVVVPFNQGSVQDVTSLIDYIYDPDSKTGLGWDLDMIIPFAAISEGGREIDDIDSKSELAHRIMLTNTLRILGAVKSKKQERGFNTRPALCLLPLSPNHGTFGKDGLYGESKIALETLFNRWHSESWSVYLTVIGAVIGWTRGTGLMSANNIVAEGIEAFGARTFSTHEMGFNLLGLLHPKIIKLSQTSPVWADLNGGLQHVSDLAQKVTVLRERLTEEANVRRAVAKDADLDTKVLLGPQPKPINVVTPRANMKFSFPEISQKSDLGYLKGKLDLDKVVVVTGFGEVGPFGGSRTRWEMESYGEFSLEGCIELAWVMGYIKFHRGALKTNPNYCGWVDAKTMEPVQDYEVKAKYEEQILNHTGIRRIEPELFKGYDPEKKIFLQEIAVDSDMPPLAVSQEEAAHFAKNHGPNADVYREGEQWFVKLKRGASFFVPKALRFDRLVAGQIPTGWDPIRYGIPEDIVAQVDPITLYVLVATVEALVSSGITDPYEFYEYVHVSELGNTSGGGLGGVTALKSIFRERLMDQAVQNDILQESFINTMPAWVNLLLLSSSGPIKTPVGACATAVESVEIGLDTILSGKAKVVIVGGYDDFQEEGSYEFANMKATSNAVEEMARGREPKDMCRPATTTRSGFMEAQGAGIQVLMCASLAIQMGVPIRGIVACTNTATDKEGRSIPAPGQGILTTARETKGKVPSRLLDFEYRSRQLSRQNQQIKQTIQDEYEELMREIKDMESKGIEVPKNFIQERTEHIEKEAIRMKKVALSTWSHDFYRSDPDIAPIRGALATYGLTIDDIGVASFHGTGTKANDKNESQVLNSQMKHLGRAHGNPIPAIFQKYLTGHPKGAAAAWMLNGVLQVLETGIIPGNRNADNIDAALSEFEFVLYPSRSIHTDGVKAGLLKSFGFGQVGGEVLVIHPDYLISALEDTEYESYISKRAKRQVSSYRYLHDSMTGTQQLVQVKTSPPYTLAQEESVYLNPRARASYDKHSGSWNFNASKTLMSGPKADLESTQSILSTMAKHHYHYDGSNGISSSLTSFIGLDIQLISEVNIDNEYFISRNFTPQEIEYCQNQPDVAASFAGRWAAKEAVVKALGDAATRYNNKNNHQPSISSQMNSHTQQSNATFRGIHALKGAGSPLKDIEIIRYPNESPTVKLHGEAFQIAESIGVKDFKVTISHSGSYAAAMATAA